MEPILNRIANDRSVIAVPLVNHISLDNMGLIQTYEFHFGWNWDLMFRGYSYSLFNYIVLPYKAQNNLNLIETVLKLAFD